MKYIILVVVLISSSAAFANDLYLIGGGWSMDRKYDTYLGYEFPANTDHNIVGVEYKNWVVARFDNSYYDESYIVGRKYHVYSHSNISIDLSVGAMYGYVSCSGGSKFVENNDYKWCPAVVPELTYTKYKLQPSLMLFGKKPVLAIKFKF